MAQALGCAFAKPLDAPGEMDVVFHASATATGLSCALACAGFEASVVEMSWYGDEPVAAPLGLDFHSRRLRLIDRRSATSRRCAGRAGTTARRLDMALALLRDDRLDALITDEVAFDDAAGGAAAASRARGLGTATAIRYS